MTTFASSSRIRAVLFGILLCILACVALTAYAAPAHALFTTEVQLNTKHTVKAFPTSLSVNANGYKARQNAIDRSQLKVTATFSDGSTRTLGSTEYSLTTASIPSGEKGLFSTEARYEADGHRVTASFDVSVNEAYGAQYGDTLVFGRGLPAQTYSGKSLSNTTWGIEAAGCSPRWNKGNLTTVVDIDKVTPVSMAGWFNSCPTMKSVVLDQLDTSRVTTLDNLFSGNTAMVTADVSKWDVSHVTSIHRMFSTCSSLKTLDLSAWKTPALVDAALAFYKATTLTTTGNLSGWNMSRVTTMDNMFDLCYALKTIGNVSGWNTANVTGMMCTFAECYVITVDCSKWNANKVTNHFEFDRQAPGVLIPSFPS